MPDNGSQAVARISKTDSGFVATCSHFATPMEAATLEDLAEQVLGNPPPESTRWFPLWKVEPFSMRSMAYIRVDLAFLIDLLKLPGARSYIDLSHCYFGSCDLSTSNMDRQGVEGDLRWNGVNGLDLSKANLTGASFDGATLGGCSFSGANLTACRFENCDMDEAEFRDANLKDAWFNGCRLVGANFFRAMLEGATFAQAELEDASFSNANLREASFNGSSIEEATFYLADLTSADFRRVRVGTGASWTDARFDRTSLFRRDVEPIMEEANAKAGIGTYGQAMEVFLSLKANFVQLGNYEDAAWAYLKEQQMEKASNFPTTAGKRRLVRWVRLIPRSYSGIAAESIAARFLIRARMAILHVRLFLGIVPSTTSEAMRNADVGGIDRPRWLRSWAFELLTGYGERPMRPVVWGGLTILAFFLAYWGAGNVASGDSSVGLSPSHDWVDALTHSISAFATIGFNTLEPVGWGARLLTAVESILGIGFFALFIYTLGNRMSRS